MLFSELYKSIQNFVGFRGSDRPNLPWIRHCDLRKVTVSIEAACVERNAGAEPTVFFKRETRFQWKAKWTARFFNAAHQHNSFFNCNNCHCFFGNLYPIFFSIAERIRFWSYFLFQLQAFRIWSSFNSFCKIRFDIAITVWTVTRLLKPNLRS